MFYFITTLPWYWCILSESCLTIATSFMDTWWCHHRITMMSSPWTLVDAACENRWSDPTDINQCLILEGSLFYWWYWCFFSNDFFGTPKRLKVRSCRVEHLLNVLLSAIFGSVVSVLLAIWMCQSQLQRFSGEDPQICGGKSLSENLVAQISDSNWFKLAILGRSRVIKHGDNPRTKSGILSKPCQPWSWLSDGTIRINHFLIFI